MIVIVCDKVFIWPKREYFKREWLGEHYCFNKYSYILQLVNKITTIPYILCTLRTSTRECEIGFNVFLRNSLNHVGQWSRTFVVSTICLLVSWSTIGSLADFRSSTSRSASSSSCLSVLLLVSSCLGSSMSHLPQDRPRCHSVFMSVAMSSKTLEKLENKNRCEYGNPQSM